VGGVPTVLHTGLVVKVYVPTVVLAANCTTALPASPFCAAGITGGVEGHPGIVQLVIVTDWVRSLVKVSELTPALALPPVQALTDISFSPGEIFSFVNFRSREITFGFVVSN
jgi:hypothetical protein